MTKLTDDELCGAEMDIRVQILVIRFALREGLLEAQLFLIYENQDE